MNNEVSEKKYIEFLANEYLAGKSFRKISEDSNYSHVTIRKKITDDLKEFNYDLYSQVMEKVSDNTPKTVKDPEVVKRILRAYRSLVIDNKTVSQIAQDEGVGDFVIYRDLSRRIRELHAAAPEIITIDMLKRINETFTDHSMDNLVIIESPNARS